VAQVASETDENKTSIRPPCLHVPFVTTETVLVARALLRLPRRCAPWLARAAERSMIALLVLALIMALPQVMALDNQRMLVAAQRLGPQAVAGVRSLQPLLVSTSDADEVNRLIAINQFFNRRIVFTDDEQVWGVTDHWASPLELLERGRGDCEDYAIAKYFSLIAAGVPMQRLRLIYVRAQVGGPGGLVQAHMVLAHYAKPDAEPLILDNLVDDLKPASRRPDLTPVFSFNGEGLWQGAAGPAAGDPTARLSRWREVLAKARAEGFQ
jgi:predicted transglutaminase-like cysteine proteinase